jgi:hypothetical protein
MSANRTTKAAIVHWPFAFAVDSRFRVPTATSDPFQKGSVSATGIKFRTGSACTVARSDPGYAEAPPYVIPAQAGIHVLAKDSRAIAAFVVPLVFTWTRYDA